MTAPAGNWWAEAWDLPGIGTTKRVARIPVIDGSISKQLSGVGTGQIRIPAATDGADNRLADILDPDTNTNRLIKIIDRGQEVQAFFPEDGDDPYDDDAASLVKITGPGIENVLSWAAILPYDKSGTGTGTSHFPDWIWAGQEMLENGDFEAGREIIDDDPDSGTFGEGTGVFNPTAWELSPYGAQASTSFVLETSVKRNGTYSLKINPLDAAGDPSGKWAGVQQIVKVNPGGIYQATLWAYTSDATARNWRLVCRDIDGNKIPCDEASDHHTQTIPQNTWTEYNLTNLEVPDNVDTVIFRFAFVDATGNPGPVYIDDCSLREGAPATNAGDIVLQLLDPIQTRGTLTFLGTTFTDTLDSAGNAWDTDDLSVAIAYGGDLLGALNTLATLGYEWTVTPDGSNGYDLNLYNPGGAGTDHTSSQWPAFKGGFAALPSTVRKSIPPKNYVFAVGDGGVWAEDSDATDITNYERREKVIKDQTVSDTGTAALIAEADLNVQDTARFGIKISVLDTDRIHPLHSSGDGAVHLGDTVPVDYPGKMTEAAYRVVRWVAKFPDDGIPQWTGDVNRVVLDDADAAAAIIKRLVRGQTARGGGTAAKAAPGITPGGLAPIRTNPPLDVTPPSQPKAPTLTALLGAIRVTHALGIDGGSDYTLESDTIALRVYASTTTGFTPATTDLVGVIPVGIAAFSAQVPVSTVFAVASGDLGPWYVKVTAVDWSGNESAASSQAAVTAQQVGAVDATDLANDIIEEAHYTADSVSIRALAVASFENMLANGGFEAGTVDGDDDPNKYITSSGTFANTTARSGTRGCRYDHTAQVGESRIEFNGDRATPSRHQEASLGDKIVAWGYMRYLVSAPTAGSYLQFRIQGFDAAGAATTDSGVTDVRTTLTTSWQKIEAELTIADADTAYVVLEVRIDDLHTVGMVLTFDGCYMRRANEGLLIVDGAIIADHIATNAISATAGHILDLDADDITAGTITGRTVRGASSGTRWELTSGVVDESLSWYEGATKVGHLGIYTSLNRLQLGTSNSSYFLRLSASNGGAGYLLLTGNPSSATSPGVEIARDANGRVLFVHAGNDPYTNTIAIIATDENATSGFDFLKTARDWDGTLDIEHALRANGDLDIDGSTGSPATDYAELFENATPGTIPPGTPVTLDGDKVRPAAAGDWLLGIVSAIPSVIGNAPIDWPGRYQRTKWGDYALDADGHRIETGDFDPELGLEWDWHPTKYTDDEIAKATIDCDTCATTGTVTRVLEKRAATRRPAPPLEIEEACPDCEGTGRTVDKDLLHKIRPPEIWRPVDISYSRRQDRPDEWTVVGLLGQLPAVDDGTCQPGRHATITSDGRLGHSDNPTDWRVLTRIDADTIKVLVR